MFAHAFTRRSHVRLRLPRRIACLGVVLLAACDQPALESTPPSVGTPAVRAYVTGDAARSLDAAGRFEAAGAAPSTPDQPIITRERAGLLAVSFVRTWGRYYQDDWRKERGEAINLETLGADPRIFYAETPYGRVPEGFHPAFQRAFGPWYLVTLTQGREPALVVAVSAYNTDMTIDGHGLLVQPKLSGTDFYAWGVAARTGTNGLRPVTPEQSVEAVGRRGGARTQRTPNLVLLGHGVHPASAVWKLDLDRSVQVRAGGKARQVRTLYAGPGGRHFVPRPVQPTVYQGPGVLYGASGQRVGPAALDVPVKPGEVVEFDEVTIETPEG